MRKRGWLCVHQQTSMGDKGRLKVHHNSCRCRRSRNRSLFNSNNKACNIKCVARFRFQQRGDCPEGVGGESWGWMLQIEQKLLRAFGRVPQHEIGTLVHWASPFSLSLILFCYKGKSWAWHPRRCVYACIKAADSRGWDWGRGSGEGGGWGFVSITRQAF